MLRGRKAQALTEFMILGSLIIIAFAFLINYSEKINRQQSIIQQAFRAALKEAWNANNAAQYTKVAFRRMPSIVKPMELGQLQSFSGSASVLWASGGAGDEHGPAKYQLNEDAAIDIPYSDALGPGTSETSVNTFTNTIDSTTTYVKQENAGNIITTRSLSATDTLQSDVMISGDSYSFTHTLGDGGKYYPSPSTVSRSRSMQ